MKGKIRFFGLVMVLAFVAAVTVISASGWAQNSRPPTPPPTPADPAIVCLAGNAGGGADLMVMNADGSNRIVILSGRIGKTDITYYSPHWSPDGKRIAFASNYSGYGIYVINRDGSGLFKVVALTQILWTTSPHWSPDGTQIIYADQPVYRQKEDIYLVNAVPNALPVRLTNTPDDSEFYPAWSPDGLRIAAKVYVRSIPQIRIFRLEGGVAVFEKDLTATGPLSGVEGMTPEWANLASRVIASIKLPNEDTNDIWVIDINDPGAPVNITQTPAIDEGECCWSPTDAQILYERNGSLYTVNADGSGVKLIAAPPKRSTNYTWPDWRRNL